MVAFLSVLEIGQHNLRIGTIFDLKLFPYQLSLCSK
jgi:hypothetical protein